MYGCRKSSSTLERDHKASTAGRWDLLRQRSYNQPRETGRLTLIDQVCFLVLCVEVIMDDQHAYQLGLLYATYVE